MAMRKRWLPWATVIYLAVYIPSSVALKLHLRENSGSTDSKTVGSVAPSLALSDTSDGTINLALVYQQHAVTLVTVWATWCIGCRFEMAALRKVYANYKDRGIEIIAISIDKDRSKLMEYVQSVQIPFPIAIDNTGKFVETLGARALPTTIVVGRDGKILASFVGSVEGYETQFDEWLLKQ